MLLCAVEIAVLETRLPNVMPWVPLREISLPTELRIPLKVRVLWASR